MACGYCHNNGHCVFKDDVVELNKIFEEADGLIVISPVAIKTTSSSDSDLDINDAFCKLEEKAIWTESNIKNINLNFTINSYIF